MTLAPGPYVEDGAGTSAAQFPTDIATTFYVGEAERGPVGVPIYIRNAAEIVPSIGDRPTGNVSPAAWDGLQLHFALGGGPVYFSRLAGGTPVASKVDLNDSVPAATLRVTAATRVVRQAGQPSVLLASPGAWGDKLNAAVVAGTVGFIVVVTHDDLGELERSPDVATTTDAILWSQAYAKYGLFSELAGTGNPATVALPGSSMSGGTDDRGTINTASSTTAWSKLAEVDDLGYGQAVQPGATSEALREVVIAHTKATGRVPRLAATNTATVSTLVAEAAAVKDASGREAATIEAPAYLIKEVAAGAGPRTVTADVVAAALESRNDLAGVSPNQAAAGESGIAASDLIVGLAQDKWTTAERATLNDAGVTVHRVVGGQIRRYGIRTLADSTDETNEQQPAHRLKMWLKAKLRPVGESFVAKQISQANLLKYAAEIEAEVKKLVDVPDPALASYTVTPGDLKACQQAKQFQADIAYKRFPGAETSKITISQEVAA